MTHEERARKADQDAALLATLRDALDAGVPEHAGDPLRALGVLLAAHGAPERRSSPGARTVPPPPSQAILPLPPRALQ